MIEFDYIEKEILCTVANIDDLPEGAYNFRINGKSVGRNSTENIEVASRSDGRGLKIKIASGTKGEVVHIPVIVSESGLKEVVYNDFYIGDGAEVLIVAGCGIFNCGSFDSVHNGVHRFYVGKDAKIKYIEKHYGFGPGRGGKILNPTTRLFLKEGSFAELEMEQIKGVDSTARKTFASLGDNSMIKIKERLMTHGRQAAKSSYLVRLNGFNSVADIESRSVAQDYSCQLFNSRIVGDNYCRGHTACNAIIMDSAQVQATPSLDAKCIDAELIHEAAIGKIAGEQLIKLMSLGLDAREAESRIVNGFLK